MTAEASPAPTVIVTGASRGLGLAITRRLAEAGYRVLAIARAPGEALPRLAAQPGGGEVVFRPFDLAQIEDIGPLVRDLRGEFGAPFGLINNAALGTHGLLANMPLGQIEALVRLNTLSPIVLTKFVARAMMAAGAGRIVNIASIVASTGYNGLAAYAATKASMIGFTRSLARELGRVGVTVNAIAPGLMETEMTDSLAEEDRARIVRRSALGRLIRPDDVADSVLHLLGEGGRNITGSVLTIDAGSTA